MRSLICSMAALFLVQCVTIPRGPMQRVRLDSKPAGASVKLTDCGVGSSDQATTPATVFVNRRATRCTLTVSHPEYDSRTFVLLRKGISTKEQDLWAAAEILAESQSAGELIVMGTLGGVAWVIGRGVDGLTGARYEQNRTRIIVDFTRPVSSKLTGRYKLVLVNGEELPARTWKLRNRDCEVHTISGWLLLEEGDNWNSVITEEESCGETRERLADRTAKGLFTVDGERIQLESEGFVNSAVLQGDRLELTMRGLGFRHGQTAVYAFQLTQ